MEQDYARRCDYVLLWSSMWLPNTFGSCAIFVWAGLCIANSRLLQSEFLSKMGVTVASASWASVAAISGAAAIMAVLAGYAVQRIRMRQQMHDEIHEIM